MSKFMFTAAGLLLATTAASAATTPVYDLVYNAGNGGLTIEGVVTFDDKGTSTFNDDVGGLQNYVIESNGSLFLENNDPAEHFNHLRPINIFTIGGMTFVGGTGSSTSNTISASNDSANGLYAGQSEFFLGYVLPAGLTDVQYFADIQTQYVNSFGKAKQSFNLVYVPEPTSLALLSIAGLAVMRRRRR